ncbi:MAG: Adenosine deaminase [uncultured Rubrobacteraceae bacterium]|jgi:adenosine deaminase|uniref:Adenine deaminase n=1 Tax=uncultured Rubrobacteraceae bacterium TaxID=349277 RepID=A0A6J4Q5C0_9ACTN|nr:MAG: Adenosine deaminase [uncultured Rubrobacteraceae bacterium]
MSLRYPAAGEAFLRGLPKAELHVHIEGSLEPEMMFEIARRNGIALEYASVEEVREAYDFADLQSFLDLYYKGMRVLLCQKDFYDLTLAYLEKAASQGVRHAEIFFDPQAHTDRGVPFKTAVTGIRRALLDGERRLGVSSRLILCFLRHLSADEAMQTLQEALPYKGWIVGVGLDSSEVGHPPEGFRSVFEEAARHGFLRVAHAGEEGPPEYIWQALDDLGAVRIDHGVRCVEDPELLERLREGQVPLTVCPLSNIRLRCFSSIEEHPVKRMLEEGLRVTVNSDDPAYFGGYVAENYAALRDGLGFTREDFRAVAENSFLASFLDEGEKKKLLDELASYFEA